MDRAIYWPLASVIIVVILALGAIMTTCVVMSDDYTRCAGVSSAQNCKEHYQTPVP